MDVSVIGESIQRLRKLRGMTQRELGEAVGVSTQAVSQWECGGTPDVSLLPAIADELGVDIDALFGREGGCPQDVERAATAWLRAQPAPERMRTLTRLVWHLTLYALCPQELPEMSAFAPHCELDLGDGVRRLFTSFIGLQSGDVYGVAAEDMSFMSLFPKPEAGFPLAENDAYRALFAALAEPGALEILQALARRENSFCTAQVAAARAGLEPGRAAAVMERLARLDVLDSVALDAGEGEMGAYAVPASAPLVPFLTFARWLMEGSGAHFVSLREMRAGKDAGGREAE